MYYTSSRTTREIYKNMRALSPTAHHQGISSVYNRPSSPGINYRRTGGSAAVPAGDARSPGTQQVNAAKRSLQYEKTMNHGLRTICQAARQYPVTAYGLHGREARITHRVCDMAARDDAVAGLREQEENVTCKEDLRERHDNGPVPPEDAPADGDRVRGEDDHRGAAREADDEREPEALEDLGDLLPEVRPLDLLLRRAPCDVVREEVGEQGLGEVDTEPAEEEKAAGDVSHYVLQLQSAREGG